jgi:hypothetical protein
LRVKSSFAGISQMLGGSVLRDLDVESLVKAFRVRTEAGTAALRERLSQPVADSAVIHARQKEWVKHRAAIRNTSTKTVIHVCITDLRTHEADVRSMAVAGSDERYTEWYTQILWSASGRFAWLNRLGWLTELIVLFRTVLLPVFAGVLPLFVFAAPLVFAFFQGKELNGEEYMKILNEAIQKALPPVMGKPRFQGKGGALEIGERFVHIGASVAMFAASIWSQISSALKMRVVVRDMRIRATAVRTYASAVSRLATLLGVQLDPTVPLDWDFNTLGCFGAGWNDPDSVVRLLAAGGHLDMLVAVAHMGRTCIPAEGTMISLTDIWHPNGTKKDKSRVYNSVEMGSDSDSDSTKAVKAVHALLTGPNRGGKTTFLRALGSAVLMHQTLGIVFARQATLPVFRSMETALSPAGVLGKSSLFEAEIDFARSVKERPASDGPLFLIMDEIFHGTNAHDGVEAAQVFLDWLYTQNTGSIYSVVSTHYLDLPRRYTEEQVQPLCMEASRDPVYPERLRYSYRLREGINEFSSVREILRERGLLSPLPDEGPR